ncbi:hypothetical protein IKQ19_04380 [Candidatus Saccharibacteria bacterium]|nr:hypothetical protein [Candidatus Saccharibacteria bacterium]
MLILQGFDGFGTFLWYNEKYGNCCGNTYSDKCNFDRGGVGEWSAYEKCDERREEAGRD